MPSEHAIEGAHSAERSHPATRVRYVSGVSWPRSGHHAVANVLAAYFGPRFTYCEHYIPTDCCKSQPCTRAGVSLSKNHDFEFDTVVSENVPYLIQYRKFVNSVVSNYEVALYNGAIADDFDSFKFFSLNYANKYVRFVQKWVFDARRPKERLVVQYETLMADPLRVMARVVDFFAPGCDIDQERLDDCIRSSSIQVIGLGALSNVDGHGLKTNRDIKTFRYYDSDLFNMLDVVTWFPEP